MKLKLAITTVVTSVLLIGCAGTAIGFRTTNSPSMGGSAPPPGTSYSSVAIQAEVTPGTFFGLVFLGYILVGIDDAYSRWSYGPAWRRPGELAEDRAIADRDCSQPLEPLYANLRCK